MTEYTRPATWDDVLLLVGLLEAEDVRFALIDGYALAAHGLVRFSEHVDVLVDPSDANTERWVRALPRLPDGAARELIGERALFAADGPKAIRINDEFTVDVMAAACGHDYADLAPYIERKRIDATVIPVLSPAGLLLTKQGARERDRADAKALRALIAATAERD